MPMFDPGIPASELGKPNGVAQLDSGGKLLLSELPITGRQYKGTWNASTNTPVLVNGVGTAGDEYVCTVAGSPNFGAGAIAFAVGEVVAYNGSVWEKVPAGWPVVEVNGKTGAITLTPADIGALPAVTTPAVYAFDGPSLTAAPTLRIGGPSPQYETYYTPGAADAKRWNWLPSANAITFRALNDVGNAATNVFQVFRTGATVTLFALEVPSLVLVPANGNKLWLAKYNSGSGHNNAPTAFDASANYLQIGGREYGNNGYAGIGFGYVSAVTDHPCVMIGHEEKGTAGNTNGDFIVATRPTTTNVAPTIQFRITPTGQVQLTNIGTVAAPAFVFATNLTTGFYVPTPGQLGLVANGAERIRATATGMTVFGNIEPSVPNASTLGSQNFTFRQAWLGTIIQPPSVLASNGTFTDTDPDEQFMDANAGNLTVQINMASTSVGKRFLFKKIDASANTVTLTLSAGTIDGAPSVVLSARWQWIEVRIINATTAYIIGKG